MCLVWWIVLLLVVMIGVLDLVVKLILLCICIILKIGCKCGLKLDSNFRFLESILEWMGLIVGIVVKSVFLFWVRLMMVFKEWDCSEIWCLRWLIWFWILVMILLEVL